MTSHQQKAVYQIASYMKTPSLKFKQAVEEQSKECVNPNSLYLPLHDYSGIEWVVVNSEKNRLTDLLYIENFNKSAIYNEGFAYLEQNINDGYVASGIVLFYLGPILFVGSMIDFYVKNIHATLSVGEGEKMYYFTTAKAIFTGASLD